MFRKAFELCDVVSVCLFSQETEQVMLTGQPNHSESGNLRKAADLLYRFPCVKVSNEEWMKTAVDLAISLVGKAITVSLQELIRVWVPFNAHKFFHHIVFLVKVTKDDKKKIRGSSFKVFGTQTSWWYFWLLILCFAVDDHSKHN